MPPTGNASVRGARAGVASKGPVRKLQVCAGGMGYDTGRANHGREPVRRGPAPPAADGLAARTGAGAGVEGGGGGPGPGPQDAERQHGAGPVVRAWRGWPWSVGCWPPGTRRRPDSARRFGRWSGGWMGWRIGLRVRPRSCAAPWQKSQGLWRAGAGSFWKNRAGNSSGWRVAWTGWRSGREVGGHRKRPARAPRVSRQRGPRLGGGILAW